MKKKTINKKKISKECWNLNVTFLNWLRVRLPVYLREASTIIDLDWRRFKYRGEELTQRQLIERMIYLLKIIEGKDFWDGKEEYEEPCNEILEIWSTVFHAMWW